MIYSVMTVPVVKQARCIFLLLCCCGCFFSGAQNTANYLEVKYTPLHFNLVNASELESRQVKASAFELLVVSRQAYSLYVSMLPSSSAFPVNLWGIRLRQVAPSEVVGNFQPFSLSYNSQLIAQGGKSNQDHVKTHTWTYDLLLEPVLYDVAPGTYSFSVLFTMTQP